MNKVIKIYFFIGALIEIVGLALIGATAYQEEITEPASLEDYHMKIPTGRYVYRSRDLRLTQIGAGIMMIGTGLLMLNVLIHESLQSTESET